VLLDISTTIFYQYSIFISKTFSNQGCQVNGNRIDQNTLLNDTAENSHTNLHGKYLYIKPLYALLASQF